MTPPPAIAPLPSNRNEWPAPDLGGVTLPDYFKLIPMTDAGPVGAAAIGVALYGAAQWLPSVRESNAAAVSGALSTLIALGSLQLDYLTTQAQQRARAAIMAAAAPRSYGATSLGRPATIVQRASEGIITRTDVVAGARSEASYLMLAWNGAGELSRGSLVTALLELEADHGVRVSPPAAKTAHAHLGKAVDLLRYKGFKVSAERGRNRRDRAVRAAWVIGEGNTRGDIGDNFGRIVMRVTLNPDDTVSYSYEDGYAGMADEVSAEYRRTSGAEMYPPGDVTQWMNGILRMNFRAVRMGQVWVVPSDKARAAEQFCQALADRCEWGRDWMLPGIPVTSTTQLIAGMARGLMEEAKQVLKDLEYQRTQAQNTPRKEIGPAAAATLLARLQVISERVTSYATALGSDVVVTVRNSVDEAMAIVRPLADDASQRGAMLELS